MVRKCIEFTTFRKTAKYGATHNVFRYGLKKKKKKMPLTFQQKQAGQMRQYLNTHTHI